MILINSSPKNALKIFQPFLPIFVPVGIGYLLAAFEQKGIRIKYVDEQIEENVLDKIKEYVRALDRPYIFGFSVLTAAMKNAIELSRELKRIYPDSIILFGGIHPSALPEEILSFDHIDLVMRGESEYTLLELYDCLKKGKDFSHVRNLSFKQDGKIIHNPRASIIKDLDKLPSFPYHRFAEKEKYDLGFIMSSRGCPYQCIFCSNRVTTDRGYRYHNAETIVKQMELLYNKYNQKYILFLDDNFLVNKKRIYTLAEEIKKRGMHKKMSFNFQARGDNTDRELLGELYNSGFKSIFFGIETSSNRLLEIVKKGETLEEIIEAVKISKEIGYHVSATFIYALPSETHDDRMNCVKLCKELKIDMVRFNNATPYPGTELYEIAKKEKSLHVQGLYENFNSVSTFIENPFNKIPFSYVPRESIEKEIRKDILFSYLAIYLDLSKLKAIFTRPDQGVGWFNAGEKIFEFLKKIPSIVLLGVMLVIKNSELVFSILFQKNSYGFKMEFLKIFTDMFKRK